MNETAVIASPMCWGNGAHVIHKQLESALPGYRVLSYHPLWTLFPVCLPLVAPLKRPSLVHTTPDYAVFSARRKIPLVVTFHNYVLDPFMQRYSSKLQRIHYAATLRWFTRMAVRRADAVTAVSRFTASLVRGDLGYTGPLPVIHDGVDTDRFIPKRRSSFHDGIRVLFSGNLTRRKGAHWLLPIAQKLDRNLRIFYTTGLRAHRSLPSHPRLVPIGNVPHAQMPQRYQQMDLLVMPTVREGFGMAVAEAMACGLPVVASRCSSIPELIDDPQGGFLCPVGDVQAFADRINLLAASETLRREMGDYNRDKAVRQFALEKMVVEYERLFSSVKHRLEHDPAESTRISNAF
jgi:glycosyltransferase involved in cell wall biosynthesis